MNPHYPEASHRAAHCCEYCHAPEVVFNFPFEVEHVIPIYHKGTDDLSNQALACRSCNIHKANHLTGFDEVTQTEARLFNPRVDSWRDHFSIDEERAGILGRTEIGRATVARLQMNCEAQLVCPTSMDATRALSIIVQCAPPLGRQDLVQQALCVNNAGTVHAKT